MTERAVSLRELAFVRDVLIPRCAFVEGPEVPALVELRVKIDAICQGLEEERQNAELDRAAAAAEEAAEVPECGCPE